MLILPTCFGNEQKKNRLGWENQHQPIPSHIFKQYQQPTANTTPARPTTSTKPNQTVNFFEQTPWGQRISYLAHYYGLSPQAVLGATFAVLSASAPKDALLPPVVGYPSPVSTFVLLIGESGAGKTTSIRQALDFLDKQPHHSSPNSGEGLLDAFSEKRKAKSKTDGGTSSSTEWVQVRHRVLIVFSEFEIMIKVGGRSDNTLKPMIRDCWSGAPLRSDISKRNEAPRATITNYQAGAIAGAQNTIAYDFLRDESKGDPQRWLFMDTADRNFPKHKPTEEPAKLKIKEWPEIKPGNHIKIDKNIESEFWDNVVKRHHTGVADGHRRLVRLRIAALIGWLEGHPGKVELSDWKLAGMVMKMDEANRATVKTYGKKQDKQAAVNIGRKQGAIDTAAADYKGRKLATLIDNAAAAWVNQLKRLDLKIHCDKCRKHEADTTPSGMRKATTGTYGQRWRNLTNGATVTEFRNEIIEAAEAAGLISSCGDKKIIA